MVSHIVENYSDAVRVVMTECNPVECAKVDAVNQSGEWNFSEGPSGDTKAQLLMVEHDDCE